MTRSTPTKPLHTRPHTWWSLLLCCTALWALTACDDGMSPSTSNNKSPDMGTDQDSNTGTPDADAGDDTDADIEPCAEGLERCGDTCVNLDGDAMHCGACDMACPTLDRAQTSCQSRQCQYTCDSIYVDRNADLNEPGSDGCECEPSQEICDGEDNDCDGITDEEPDPDDLAEPLCPTAEGATGACRVGACQLTCNDNLVDLNGDLNMLNSDGCECTPQAETCNDTDDDCDGLDDAQDEDASAACPEIPGSVSTCTGSTCQYTCAEGFQDANGDLNTPDSDGCECNPSGQEICDGIDNNCNGDIDEGGNGICEPLPNASAQCQGVQGCLYTCTDGFVDLDDELGRAGGTGCECALSGDEVCDGDDKDSNALARNAAPTFTPTEIRPLRRQGIQSTRTVGSRRYLRARPT